MNRRAPDGETMDEKENDIQRLLLKEEMRLDELNAFSASHKAAFRIAFDYLNACFPPNRSEDYWDAAAKRMNHLVTNNGWNPLVKYVLLGVYDYLGEIVKDLKAQD